MVIEIHFITMNNNCSFFECEVLSGSWSSSRRQEDSQERWDQGRVANPRLMEPASLRLLLTLALYSFTMMPVMTVYK